MDRLSHIYAGNEPLVVDLVTRADGAAAEAVRS